VLEDWRLSKKMMVAFSVIGVMTMTLGVTGVMSSEMLASIATQHVKRGIAGTEALGRLMSSLREHRIIIFSQLNASTSEERAKLDERFADNKLELQKAISDYAPMAGESTPQLNDLKAQVEQLNSVDQRIFELTEASGGPAALPLVKGLGKTVSQTALKDTSSLIERHMKRAADSNDAGISTARNALVLAIALLILAMATLFAIWRLIVSTVSNPLAGLSSITKTLAAGGKADVPLLKRKDELGEVANAVEMFRQAAVIRAENDARAAAEQQVITTSLQDGLTKLAQGDLTTRVTAEFPHAYAALKANFNEALDALRELIGAVSSGASSIRTGSGEIAQASEDLARRTESNAASLEETSASLAQIDGRLKATATAAARTVERADQAITTVSGGRAVADEAVQAMGRVSESAKGIDGVIEGLDKIAFQTRVLAMNAAVEAGRAGDAGRGFAVVADLVSALAIRAEEEAKRARDQLTATQTDIITAVEAVQKVDGALADISGDVSQVHELLGTMASDNLAQSAAVTQISVAVSTMDQSTQQNAAMVEETSAAARNLTSEVQALAEQAARFRIEASSRHKPASTQAEIYASPIKPLPKAAIAALTRPASTAATDDWNAF
jgi:methyl-accepting chemotaxis protein